IEMPTKETEARRMVEIKIISDWIGDEGHMTVQVGIWMRGLSSCRGWIPAW
ncbi:hypothetical protein GWI33_003787, partial [Rhynchophorus ferrugineus]